MQLHFSQSWALFLAGRGAAQVCFLAGISSVPGSKESSHLSRNMARGRVLSDNECDTPRFRAKVSSSMGIAFLIDLGPSSFCTS